MYFTSIQKGFFSNLIFIEETHFNVPIGVTIMGNSKNQHNIITLHTYINLWSCPKFSLSKRATNVKYNAVKRNKIGFVFLYFSLLFVFWFYFGLGICEF